VYNYIHIPILSMILHTSKFPSILWCHLRSEPN